ncbi:Tubulin-tyrosine ligase family, putative [Trypanosoma equiperdum]|uniref:Tubulin--tyrosine ligase-like protein 12 SET-like domain-containing protein n=5 Tax=Trypanozoon TaxID=39700 RepID=Q386R8_TRYB2|nr:hypothetical protein, conserved [Trypanosoma brucei brucei TREU927]EAN79213.1 hypothetical protein, conserved [Trypanosoma brucei brucei TREU927]RHW68536.1 Tubulin-tyrosine ligase family [Trypanosoma brucei equiperdum]SCU73017.1 Tubulin-tyrosine ligase family, putative [Trypanosoma equiperdum]
MMKDFEAFSRVLADWFVVHSVPQHLQRSLFEKLVNDVFDAGTSFSLAVVAREDEDEVDAEDQSSETAGNYVLVASKNLKANDDIWLIDHCCTFRLRDFRAHLEANEALRTRLGRVLAVNLSGADNRHGAQLIFDHMWNKVGSYRLPTSADGDDSQYESYWFIHDEVGSAITTVVNEKANMKLEPIPICFPEKGGVFSAMWCVEDMEEEEVATRRAASTLEATSGKEILSLIYNTRHEEETEEDPYRSAQLLCVEAWRRLVKRLESVPGRRAQREQSALAPVERCPSGPLRVFTDSQQLSQNLTDANHFVVVDLPQEAHIVWVVHHSIEGLNDYGHAQYISQFPEESEFTSKQGLLRLIQETYGYVDWYQTSYDSTTQLKELIGDFIVRKAALDKKIDTDPLVTYEDIGKLRSNDGTNLWISKPTNLARSIDMTLSSNLTELLRAVETGPKVICKYIANTATLRKRKFDLRFIVAVNSFTSEHSSSMEAYVYNTFWTRFALKEYSLDDFDCYEKHWTVMNYTNPEALLQLHDHDFVKEFNEEYASSGYGEAAWEKIAYPKILKMLREAFGMVVTRGGDHSRCRAMYGVDVMLRTERCVETGALTLEPSLLEITFSPDCRRACKYHPTFFNDIFHTLFLRDPTNMTPL